MRVKASKRIRAGETIEVSGQRITAPAGGMKLGTAGLLKELTITALGCDAETSVAIAAQYEGSNMKFEQWLSARGFSQATLDETQRTSLQAMYDAEQTQPDDRIRTEERERIGTINAACRGSWGSHQATVDRMQSQAIAGEIELPALQASLLSIMRTSRPAAPTGGPGGDDHSRQHIEAALLLRTGMEGPALEAYGERVVNQAGELRGSSLPELAAMALRLDGMPVPRSRDEMIRAAMGVSTLSLPTALGNAINRSLIAAYQEAPATWRSFAAVRAANDFKAQTSIRPSFVGELEEVGAGGELKHGTLGEALFNESVDTYGKMLTLTRTSIINDDLGFLDETAPGMARAALRKLSDLVWTIIMANAGSHFSSGNGNVLTSGSALSLTGLEAGVKAMRKQADAQGNNIDIVPKTLVVSPDLEITAKNLLNSQEIQAAEGVPRGNALQSVVNLEVGSRLSNTGKFNNASLTQWFLFGTPMDVPVIAGFLDGQQTPKTDSFGFDATVDKLVVSWRIYHDFGAALGDAKAGLKATGAA